MTAPIRVLAFSDVALPEGSGGVERQIEEVYSRWVATGEAEVLLVALGDRALPMRDIRSGVRIVRARQVRLARLVGAQVTLSYSVLPLALRAVRVFQPDVIHAHTLFYASSLAALATSRRSRVPMALTAHIGSLEALPQPYRTLSGAYERVIGRALVRQAEETICVGVAVGKHIERLVGRDAHLTIVPNGVDSERFHPGSRQLGTPSAGEPLVVATVGRLIFNKGHHDVIEAVRALHETGRRVELRVVGDGPMRRRLETQASDLVRAGIVTFLGHRDDVETVLRECDVLVRASMTESTPMAVLEAMATGIPVIASDVGSVRDLIEDGTSGMLTPPRSPESVAAALTSLADDLELRARLGRAARETALHFSWERCANDTLAAISAMLARRAQEAGQLGRTGVSG